MHPSQNLLKTFVVGPIGDKDAAADSVPRVTYEEGMQVLEEVILPACQAFGIDAIRADGISRLGEIPEQVFRQLRDAPLVIADLTGANPNVMYELGLRHTTGKLTIQIGERDRLPFDIAAIRTIMFKRTPLGLIEARKTLSKTLAVSLESGADPVTATRIWFELPAVDIPKSEVTKDNLLGGESEEDDTPGFLEQLSEMEEGTQSLNQTMLTATSVTEEIGRILGEASKKVNELDKTGAGASARLALVNRTAALLEDPATRLQVIAGDFGATVNRIEPGLTYLLQRLAEEPEQLQQLPEFVGSIRKLVEAAQTAADGATAFGKTSVEIGAASRSLRKVGNRLGKGFEAIAQASRRVAAWKTLAAPLL